MPCCHWSWFFAKKAEKWEDWYHTSGSISKSFEVCINRASHIAHFESEKSAFKKNIKKYPINFDDWILVFKEKTPESKIGIFKEDQDRSQEKTRKTSHFLWTGEEQSWQNPEITLQKDDRGSTSWDKQHKSSIWEAFNRWTRIRECSFR